MIKFYYFLLGLFDTPFNSNILDQALCLHLRYALARSALYNFTRLLNNPCIKEMNSDGYIKGLVCGKGKGGSRTQESFGVSPVGRH